MGAACCENTQDGLLVLDDPPSQNSSIVQNRKKFSEKSQQKRKAASSLQRISIDGVSVCSSEAQSEVLDSNDQDTFKADGEGRLELSMIDVSSAMN